MAQSIKISDDEMDLVPAAADLNSRSSAGQVTHWMRIGRSIEQAPEFTYAHIRDALEGNRSPDGLTGEEQAVYIDQLLAELSLALHKIVPMLAEVQCLCLCFGHIYYLSGR